MRPELVFNDLSVLQAPSETVAAQWLTSTMQTVADLIAEETCKPVIHADRNLWELDLVPDTYGFQEWVDDTSTDQDLRILAWQLTMMSPARKGLYEQVQDTEAFSRSEFFLDQQRCDALGVALSWDGIAISLPSAEHWCTTEIAIKQHLYDEDLTAFRVIHHRTRHASMPEHVDAVIDHWRRAAIRKVGSATDLLQNWSVLFPGLDLCIEHERKTLPPLSNPGTLNSVLGRLYSLNRASEHWARNAANAPEYDFRARPESKKTMERNKLKQQRIATCPRCGEAVFEMHGEIQPPGYRIYWFENSAERRFTIGYIGPHLETVRHKAK